VRFAEDCEEWCSAGEGVVVWVVSSTRDEANDEGGADDVWFRGARRERQRKTGRETEREIERRKETKRQKEGVTNDEEERSERM
jgi:hypothetical protein